MGMGNGMATGTISAEDFWYGTELDISHTRREVAHDEETSSFWALTLCEDPSSYWSWELGAAAAEHYDEPELDTSVWFYGGVGG